MKLVAAYHDETEYYFLSLGRVVYLAIVFGTVLLGSWLQRSDDAHPTSESWRHSTQFSASAICPYLPQLTIARSAIYGSILARLAKTDVHRYLDVQISETLGWNEHVDYISRKGV